MAETETVVKYGEAVTWGPVRKLAQDISKLYSDKKIFELNEDLDESDTIISKRSTRSTDPNARVCTISSADKGYVYLSKDITAPFRVAKLGQSGEIEEKALAFEFAYHPDFYKEYLEGTKKPVLTTQYLLYKEVVENDPEVPLDCLVYTSDSIATELCDSSGAATYQDRLTITNLIESDRSKIRKFWSYKDDAEDGADFYADSTEIAGELYMLFDDPLKKGNNCCYIARVAFAGMHNNGNGNSHGPDGTPASWVNGRIAADEDCFVKDNVSPWMSVNKAVTLTGVSMDRPYKSCDDPATGCNSNIVNTVKGFRPETPGAKDATYLPPPIGCSSQFIWPTLGVEGGGENSFYSPDILSQYVDWADWREEYKMPLSDDVLEYIEFITLEPSPDDEHFPCYQGKWRTGDLSSSYAYLPTTKSVALDEPYQRWVKVNDTTYIRMVPMEFKVSEYDPRRALLAVPVTIVKILKPKSYQTAIRKRWYDMMYYTLRNIAGYKYKKYIGNEECYRVIGVTWDNEKINNTSYTNPCLSDPDDCSCTKCSYERWKVLNLGGERSATPFIGTVDEFNADSDNGTNAAQMWIWEDTRLKEITANKSDIEDYDILFPELYFERLLCYANEDLYSDEPGGFVNEEKENTLCKCLICHYTSYQTSPINLPWEGGGGNTTCESEESDTKSTVEPTEVTIYNTHAYTFKVLQDLTTFIAEYKLYEDAPRDISDLEIGYCYCPATSVDTGITLNGMTVSHYACPNGENSDTCVPESSIDLLIPEVPSYYNTLSRNEKASLKSSGKECLLEIAKDLKPYGYSAYIWKAVDIGGYIEYRKDIKIEFIHYNPARVCSSGTIMGSGVRELYDPTAEDDPLYMYNTNCCYTSPYPTATVTDSPRTPVVACPNDEGSIRAFDYNHDYGAWREALYWSNKSPVSDCVLTPDPAAMASAKIWNRSNANTSIGTIEIYVAPYFTDNKYAKFLGSCNPQRVPPSENSITEEDKPYKVFPYACGTIPVSESMSSEDQDVNSANSFTEDPNATKIIKFEVRHQPTGSKGDPNNYVQVDITIPHELLIDEKTPDDTTYGLDLRQKYIILAVRASHTYIDSGLANKNGQADATNYWATRCAGACRYAEFQTAYKFSSVKPSTS